MGKMHNSLEGEKRAQKSMKLQANSVKLFPFKNQYFYKYSSNFIAWFFLWLFHNNNNNNIYDHCWTVISIVFTLKVLKPNEIKTLNACI